MGTVGLARGGPGLSLVAWARACKHGFWVGSGRVGGSKAHTTLKSTFSLLPRALRKQGGKGAALCLGCTALIVFGWWRLPMVSCRCRPRGCVRGAGEMSLETLSPPASDGLVPHGVMAGLESPPVLWVIDSPKPTSPNLRRAAPSSHPRRSTSLLSWAGWLRATAAGHGTATRPPSASCWPLGWLARLGAVLPRAPHCHQHPARRRGEHSTEERKHRLLWEADPWADLLYQRQTEKNTSKKPTSVAPCKSNAKGTIERHEREFSFCQPLCIEREEPEERSDFN